MLFDELDVLTEADKALASKVANRLRNSNSRPELRHGSSDGSDGKTIKPTAELTPAQSRSVSRATSVELLQKEHLRSRASSSASAAGFTTRRSNTSLGGGDSMRESASEAPSEAESTGASRHTSYGDSNHSRHVSNYSLSEREGMGTPESSSGLDPAYLRAFRQFVRASAENDAFVSRSPRFDAIQAHRICSRLRDEYPLQVVAPKKERRASDAKPQSHANSKARLREAGEEIMTSLWALMAARWMNFGRIIISPAHDTLVAHCAKQLSKRATIRFDGRAAQMLAQAQAGSKPFFVEEEKERRRVLDLGGMPVADWGWHCAVDYPKVKVYTVTQRPRPLESALASPTSPDVPTPAPPHFRGPKNHRHLSVDRLYKLPFPDNHFDVVSTRTLFLILKSSAPSSRSEVLLDEYDRCLEECLRVLKPGGYFEWQLFDADVINAGPQAEALYSRFAQLLRGMGRDPEPTKRWIPRLYNAGFTDLMRGWMFYPLAPPASKPAVPAKDDEDLVTSTVPPRPGSDSQDPAVIAEQVRRRMQTWEDGASVEDKDEIKGSTKDVAAVAGLLGGWVWEKWLRAAGIVEESTVGSVIEEAKEWGSGLRSLVGYARKPLV
ncbi:hypothetical protein FN846DRAFT_3141 [Sphaerosporella brunnea]|uniref:Methyltransferase type 11 domain-containing protein n=1 Tax=Sphaerosporella brunnea TaxID=1250544 RepID=A0A5J5FBI9_9PEZI|nr:hypothetical protein FN846DRAFT_3141 [Sphaerosporella brunnea]